MARIQGDRIMLREYKRDDLPYIRRWVNNSRITNNLSDTFIRPHTLSETETFLESRLKNPSSKEMNFVIADRGKETYIGQIDLMRIDYKNRVAELGIVIGNEKMLGQGFGTESVKLILAVAFDKLNLHKVELKVHDYNKRAIACYEKCGFKEEGRLRENFYINGRYRDQIHMGILKREYEEKKMMDE